MPSKNKTRKVSGGLNAHRRPISRESDEERVDASIKRLEQNKYDRDREIARKKIEATEASSSESLSATKRREDNMAKFRANSPSAKKAREEEAARAREEEAARAREEEAARAREKEAATANEEKINKKIEAQKACEIHINDEEKLEECIAKIQGGKKRTSKKRSKKNSKKGSRKSKK